MTVNPPDTPWPSDGSAGGRRTPRCICRTPNGVHAQGCQLARVGLPPLSPRADRVSVPAYSIIGGDRSVCSCGTLLEFSGLIGAAGPVNVATICPRCDRA